VPPPITGKIGPAAGVTPDGVTMEEPGASGQENADLALPTGP